MSTLAVVEEILRETGVPMSVREIVVKAGPRLPSKSKTPDTVVARDLAMDIKRKGDTSLFSRTSPGRYTLRALAAAAPAPTMVSAPVVPSVSGQVTPAVGALKHERAPALAAKRERPSDAASQVG